MRRRPVFGPCRNLDYELELGTFVGPGNPLGATVPIAGASTQLFGIVLLNAGRPRYPDLGNTSRSAPFLAKNFATSISPWIVTMEALAPFRCPALIRPDGDPAPLPHLSDANDQARGAFDISSKFSCSPRRCARPAGTRTRLTSGNFKKLYWTLAQLLTHHASNGCNLQPGDLLEAARSRRNQDPVAACWN